MKYDCSGRMQAEGEQAEQQFAPRNRYRLKAKAAADESARIARTETEVTIALLRA